MMYPEHMNRITRELNLRITLEILKIILIPFH